MSLYRLLFTSIFFFSTVAFSSDSTKATDVAEGVVLDIFYTENVYQIDKKGSAEAVVTIAIKVPEESGGSPCEPWKFDWALYEKNLEKVATNSIMWGKSAKMYYIATRGAGKNSVGHGNCTEDRHITYENGELRGEVKIPLNERGIATFYLDESVKVVSVR